MKALNNSLRRLVSYKHVEVKFHQEGRQALFSGITKLNQAVMQTLGPKVILMQGSNIAIDYEIGDPKVTKDGVTVAKHIEFKDIWEDLGSKLIKFSANESNVYAGDGTTTSTILTTYILQNGLKYLEKGFHPILVKEGLVRAGNLVDNYLIDRSIPITNELELYAICKIACNNDTSLADMIFSGLLNAGKDGGFLIEEGTTNEDKLCVFYN
jgi:chaperonin GroEL